MMRSEDNGGSLYINNAKIDLNAFGELMGINTDQLVGAHLVSSGGDLVDLDTGTQVCSGGTTYKASTMSDIQILESRIEFLENQVKYLTELIVGKRAIVLGGDKDGR